MLRPFMYTRTRFTTSAEPLLFFRHYFCTFAKQITPVMSCLQVILAIIFPPLAVIDRGCGSMLIVFLLTLCGWVPGVIAALIILNKNTNSK